MNGEDRIRRGLIAALVVSAMIGPGFSYGPVYAFHLVLAAAWIWLLRTDGLAAMVARLKEQRFTLIFMGASLAWWCISLLWVENRREGGMAIAYWSLGFALLTGLILLIENSALLRVALWSAGAALALEIGLGILEVLTPLRWPISRLSRIAGSFGHPTDVDALLVKPWTVDYLATTPTGFHWNENDFAILVLLSLPFFFVHRRWWIWMAGIVLCGWMMIMSGARLGWLGLLILLLVVLASWKKRRWLALASIVVLVLISTNGFSDRYNAWRKVRETQVFCRTLVGADVDTAQLREWGDLGLTDGSAGARKDLFRIGVRALREHPVLGLGVGGSGSYVESRWPASRPPERDLHFWWLQVAVEGGPVIFLLYLAWWCGLFWSLFVAWRAREGEGRSLVLAMMITLIALVPAGVMPSSMIYFLPIHVLAALAIALSRYSLPPPSEPL